MKNKFTLREISASIKGLTDRTKHRFGRSKMKDLLSTFSTQDDTMGYTLSSPAEDALKERKVRSGPRPLRWIGELPITAQYTAVMALVIVLLSASAGTAWVGNRLSAKFDSIIDHSRESAVVVDRMRTILESIARGDAAAFADAGQTQQEIAFEVAEMALHAWTLPDAQRSVLPIVSPERSVDNALWSVIVGQGLDTTESVLHLIKVAESFDKVLMQQPAFTAFANAATDLRSTGTVLAAAVRRAVQAGSVDSAKLENVASRYTYAAQDYLASNGNSALMAALDSIGSAASLAVPVETSAADKPALDALGQLLNVRIPLIQRQVRDGYIALAGPISNDIAAAQSDAHKYELYAHQEQQAPTAVTVVWTAAGTLLALALASLSLLMVINSKRAEIEAWKSTIERDKTDAAIIKIMSELRPISKGDLTSRITVTEHETGSVADRINVMTESTQEAIQDVKNASTDVAVAIRAIVALIEEANMSAATAKSEAQTSKQLAQDGADAVSRAVGQMDLARAGIQDVSKQVKGFAEGAQAIGVVTDLIESMMEKTKVLALNTSLIASEAGEQGAKYRTLAKEIDKLSDDAKKSLAQIVATVQAMQGGAGQVVARVEDVTAQVVQVAESGAKALLALEKINRSSVAIESLVSDIRVTTQQQTDSATEAVAVMDRLSSSAQKFRTSDSDVALVA